MTSIPSRPASLPTGAWTEAAVRVLHERYTLKDEQGRSLESPDDVFWRVAYAIASADRLFGSDDAAIEATARRFYTRMARGEFMPNSPVLMNAGKDNGLQYAACFVLPVADDLSGIFMAIHNAALVHQSGGGTGMAFSRLRPKGSRVRTTSGVSSGPVSFLRVFDAATQHVKQGASRRGANMAILRVDHPDILEFINCKRDGGITNFNISVAITDAFMDALAHGRTYALRAQSGWPLPQGGRARGGESLGELDAREVWRAVCEAAWATGDPGLFFVDRVNASPANAVPALQQIESTNPCGEQNLPPHGVCTLGHLNLAAFVRDGAIDYGELSQAARDGVHFLDNVVEVNPYTLEAIREQARNERRIGLGVMGWADLLFALNIPYASAEAVTLARELGAFIRSTAVSASQELATQRGPFPWFHESIYRDGAPRRNSNVSTVAPTGTVSIFAGCSSGIEPLFALAFQHRVKQPEGVRVLTFVNGAVRQALAARGLDRPEILEALEHQGTLHGIPGVPEDLQAVYTTAHEVPVEWHVQHQAAWQTFSDSSVSKTINLPNAASVEDVARSYQMAWDTGCLGITVFRDGCKGEQVLNVGTASPSAPAPLPVESLKPLVEPRPRRISGETWEVASPLGEVYVTLNVTEAEEPFEIFLRVGKSGSDIEAFAEALGRLMSNFLRYNRLPDRRTRLAKIVKQLTGIGGANQVGFGANRVRSVPDAVAKALGEFLRPDEAEQMGLFNGGAAAAPPVDARVGDMCPKCGNATFIYEEGCHKCHSCGHSEC